MAYVWPTPHRAGTFTLPDTPLTLNYELHGTGPKKLFLVMGLLTDLGAWYQTVQYFTALNDGYQLCVYDNRGIGKSTAPKERYTTQKMASDALALMNHLGAGWERVHLCGISMGGMISLELCALAPERFLSLTLLTTTAGGFYQQFTAPKLFRTMALRDNDLKVQSLLTYMYGTKTLRDEHEYKRLYDYHLARLQKRIDPKPHGALGHLCAVATHFVSYERLLRIRFSGVPVLVCVGTEDQLIRETHSGVLRDTLNAVFLELPGAGHGLVSECGAPLFSAMYRHCELSHSITALRRSWGRGSGGGGNGQADSPADAAAVGAGAGVAAATAVGAELHATYHGTDARSDEWLHALQRVGCSHVHSNSCTARSLTAAVKGLCHVWALQLLFAVLLRVTSAQPTPLLQLLLTGATLPYGVAALRGLWRIVPCVVRALAAWRLGRTRMSKAAYALGARYGLRFPVWPLLVAVLYSAQVISSFANFINASPPLALFT